jgi:hypothetical protein
METTSMTDVVCNVPSIIFSTALFNRVKELLDSGSKILAIKAIRAVSEDLYLGLKTAMVVVDNIERGAYKSDTYYVTVPLVEVTVRATTTYYF